MSRTKINKVYVVGNLEEVKTTIRTSDSGKTYINGSIVIKTLVKNAETVVEMKILAFEKKVDGGINKQYDAFTKLEGMLHKKVKVSGRLQEGSMVNAQGEIVHFNEVYASFVNLAKTEDVECSTFEYSGFVVRPLYELKNKNDELLGYRFEVAQANYNDSAMQVLKFDVDKDDINIANAIDGNYTSGTTVKFGGSISYLTKTETKIEEVAFGDPIPKTLTTTIKTYRVTCGDQPFEEGGPETYTKEEITKFIADYKTADAERLAKAKEGTDTATNAGAAAVNKLTRPASLI
jgi:hypothetical protein